MIIKKSKPGFNSFRYYCHIFRQRTPCCLPGHPTRSAPPPSTPRVPPSRTTSGRKPKMCCKNCRLSAPAPLQASAGSSAKRGQEAQWGCLGVSGEANEVAAQATLFVRQPRAACKPSRYSGRMSVSDGSQAGGTEFAEHSLCLCEMFFPRSAAVLIPTFWAPTGCPTILFRSDAGCWEEAQTPQVGRLSPTRLSL